MVCSFSIENESKTNAECFERNYSHARLRDAKAHLAYVVKCLKDDGQLSSCAVSRIMKTINSFKTLQAAIPGFEEHAKMSKRARKILSRSLEGSLGFLSRDDVVSHDSFSWSQEFLRAGNSTFERRALSAIVYEQTKAACINGFNSSDSQMYKISSETIEKMQKGTIVANRLPPLISPGPFYHTEICVIEADTIDAAHRLSLLGYNPVTLNFANQEKVGGGVIRGAHAQEESLFRRSSYFLGLDIQYNPFLKKQMKGHYRIPEFGAVYTPSVTVIRGTEAEGYPFISPYQLDFIACAAYDIAQHPFSQSSEYVDKTKVKIRMILRLSVNTDHDSVVLGAFGCGAFKNPVSLVAKMFSEVLSEDEFLGQFRMVTFAILCDASENKVQIFQDALEHLNF